MEICSFWGLGETYDFTPPLPMDETVQPKQRCSETGAASVCKAILSIPVTPVLQCAATLGVALRAKGGKNGGLVRESPGPSPSQMPSIYHENPQPFISGGIHFTPIFRAKNLQLVWCWGP